MPTIEELEAAERAAQGQPVELTEEHVATEEPAELVAGTNLPQLAEQIKHEHECVLTAARTALTHARRVGQLLVEAKKLVRRGEWTHWLGANLPFGESTARNYMRIARRWDDLNQQRIADLTLVGGLKLLRRSERQESDTAPEEVPHGLPVNVTEFPPDHEVSVGREVLLRLMADYGIKADVDDMAAFLWHYDELTYRGRW